MEPNQNIRLIANTIFRPRIAGGKEQEPIIQIGNRWYTRKRFKEGKLSTVSYLRGFDIGDFRYVEQNPETASQESREAREGQNIIWVIEISSNTYKALIKEKKAWEVYESKGRGLLNKIGEI